MAKLGRVERGRKLEFAEAAHRIKPNVPLSWLWLLEWASGQSILFQRDPGVRGTYKDVTGEQTAPEHECEECDWKGATPLEAPNPFEPGRTLRACPVCKSVNLSVTVGWIASDGSKA